MLVAVEAEFYPIVNQSIRAQSLADTRLVQELDRALFENAGADASEHIILAAPFEDDGVDSGIVQKTSEQKPGGARTDDGDLGPHARISSEMAATAAFFISL
jgi:hypothetical protein